MTDTDFERIWFRVPPQFVPCTSEVADYTATCAIELDDGGTTVVCFALQSHPDETAVPADTLAAFDQPADDADVRRVAGGTATITHDVVSRAVPGSADVTISQDTAFVRRTGSSALHVFSVATTSLDARLTCADLLDAVLDTVTFTEPAVLAGSPE